MTSETKATDKPTDKPGDPADKAADGAFGGVTTHSHRAGYGDDRLERLIAYLRLHPTATLASGEGGMLVQHILLLRARIEGMSEGAKVYEDHYADARAEIDRLTRILAALREPSESVVRAGHEAYVLKIGQIYADEDHVARAIRLWQAPLRAALRAAVAAAEQEVGRE